MWNSSEGNGGKLNLGNKDLLSHARIVKCKKLRCNQNVRGCPQVPRTLAILEK